MPTGRRRTELDGKRWTRYSISVWSDVVKSTDEQRLGHPAMFPEELPGRLIEVYTHSGDLVIDPFVGTGSTCVAAVSRGRRAFGMDISETFLDIARTRLAGADAQLVCAPATQLLSYVQPKSAALCVTSPPYWDILNRRRTADYQEIRHYGNLGDDLGKIREYDRFLEELSMVFAAVNEALVPGGFCCVVVMDIRKKSSFYPFHMDLSRCMSRVGFQLDDIIIWDRRQEYNHLRPLGYPYVFRVNKVHEFILIFQKLSAGC